MQQNQLNKHKKLTTPPVGIQNYVKTMEEVYTDIVSTPMFNDEDIHLEKWGIDFFHAEQRDELGWAIAMSLMTLVNQTGYKISDYIDYQDLKTFVVNQESMCLGKNQMLMKNFNTGELSTVEITEDESGL